MAKRIDMTGETYGRVKVVSYVGISEDRRALWNCTCECGVTFITRGKDLRQGKVTSCGCARKEHCSARMTARNTTHGKRHTRLYAVWCDMKARCLNPNNTSYKDYGGRGISICREWMQFENFYDWATTTGYNPDAPFGECTLDRINTNGNYEPNNCRWVSMKVQASNRRKPVRNLSKINGGTP